MGMEDLFYRLGKKTGPALRKGKWWLRSLTGSEEEVIAAENEVGLDLSRAIVEEHEEQGMKCRTDAWIDDVGSYLVEKVMIKGRVFTFVVLEGGAPNAYALPGGFIFITESLIDLCERDANEIAFVLGHEMGHVIKKHAMDRMMNDAMFQGAMKAVSRVNPAGSVLQRWVRQTGVKFFQGMYSQENEFEADRMGVRLARAGGFDERAGIEMLKRLEGLSGEMEKAEWMQFFMSHPPVSERVGSIERYLG